MSTLGGDNHLTVTHHIRTVFPMCPVSSLLTPEDKRRALAAANRALSVVMGLEPLVETGLREEIREEIEEAVLAERERCLRAVRDVRRWLDEIMRKAGLERGLDPSTPSPAAFSKLMMRITAGPEDEDEDQKDTDLFEPEPAQVEPAGDEQTAPVDAPVSKHVQYGYLWDAMSGRMRFFVDGKETWSNCDGSFKLGKRPSDYAVETPDIGQVPAKPKTDTPPHVAQSPAQAPAQPKTEGDAMMEFFKGK